MSNSDNISRLWRLNDRETRYIGFWIGPSSCTYWSTKSAATTWCHACPKQYIVDKGVALVRIGARTFIASVAIPTLII
jgi:hypothetical protein